MFDIGVSELAVIAIVGLIVLGPERLPGVLRTTGLWIGRLRHSFNDIRADIEREAKLGDIKRELQKLGVQDSFKKVAGEINGLNNIDHGLSEAALDRRPAADRREASADIPLNRAPTDASLPLAIVEPPVIEEPSLLVESAVIATKEVSSRQIRPAPASADNS